MHCYIVTLFPEIFPGPLGSSVLGKAIKKGLLQVDVVNPRDFTTDKHKTCDDTPYGGGPGMLMKAEPLFLAVESITEKFTPDERKKTLILLTSAKGKKFTQAKARTWCTYERVILICGHYEGVDERVAEFLVDQEVRIGEYVLTGGELPAMIIIDALARLIPGVLGKHVSVEEESHSVAGVLEYPQYTKPADFRGMKIPDVLLTGNHQKIAQWRKGKMRGGK